jgi:hypothetical protein
MASHDRHQDRLSVSSLLLRWLVGMGLVTWRYLWMTTPLHRSEVHEDVPRPPPELPGGVATDRMQPWHAAVGPLYHRLFSVRIAEPRLDAAALMRTVTGDFGRLVPREVVSVHEGAAAGRRLRVGDDILVDMPGPWNGPVRVVVADDTRLRLATLAGHLEAGQIEFRARAAGDAGEPVLVFEVETWARPADRRVRLLYTSLRLAKEVQLNMWVRFCLAAVRTAGGRCADGVHIRTTVTPAGAA